jgi:acyl-homoserine-lactone acylase
VTITRDDWGIAHVHGHTDADAVFGMIYAQAEDDFPRIEANYLTNLGRTAEGEGEKAIWQDLRACLYVSEDELKADYARSPLPMRRLMKAWADSLNYFLATHPAVHPRVLTRFEPWMVMSFTEGSINGNIEDINLDRLAAFYGGKPKLAAATKDDEPRGSNGIAIAPKLTSDGGALLLINPHTSFYFRSELQMSSDEGLDVYGAATWGQFFIYQGFNPHAGWMHTTSGVDNVDEFAENVERRARGYCYWYGRTCRPLQPRPITIRYRAADGHLAVRRFTAWMTHRGPIVRSDGNRWIAFAMMNKPVEALQQSFLRTKATDLTSFIRISDLKANSSNNTVFADDKGEIAYLHPQFVPRRDDRFDYAKPIDGSDPATDWGSLHGMNELPNAVNPPNGWVDNNNNGPWSAAGTYSPKPQNYPRYMDRYGENYRGVHALKLLTGSRGWTLDKLIAAAFDNDQPAFADLIPPLIRAYDTLPPADSRRLRLAAPINLLRRWDYRWSGESVAQTLAMYWAENMWKAVQPVGDKRNLTPYLSITASSSTDKLHALDAAIQTLTSDFGRWQVPWGEVNRFQRISPATAGSFSDSAPSIPVPFASARWGSLASFGSGPKPGTKKWYGTSGNSFVAVVEFRPSGVRARAVTAGGESGDPKSPHFNDEGVRYATGNLRDVYFYPAQLNRHTERVYHPGE